MITSDQFKRFKKGNYVVLYEIKNNFFSIRGINSLTKDKVENEEFINIGIECINRAINMNLDGLSLRTPSAMILLSTLQANSGMSFRVFKDYKEIHDIETLKTDMENISLNYLKIPNSISNLCVTPIMSEEELIGHYLVINHLNGKSNLPFVYLEYDENKIVTNISYNEPDHDNFVVSWNHYIGDLDKNNYKIVNDEILIVQ